MISFRLRQVVILTVAGILLGVAYLPARQSPAIQLQQELQQAQTDLDAGQYQDAAKLLQSALATNPRLRGANYQLGFALFQLGQMEEAEQAFSKELEIEAADPYSLYYLGRIRLDAGDRAKATVFFQESLQAAEILDVREKLAACYLALGRVDTAISFLETSVRLRPELGGLHYLLGRAYKQKGRSKDAAVQFSDAARWKAKFQNDLISLGSLRQALKSGNRAEIDERIRGLATSNDSDILLASATALGQAGRPQDAVLFLNKALEIAPRNAAAHYDLARAYIALERRPEAGPELARAVQLKSGFYEAELLFGTLLAGDGQGEEAIKHLRAAAQVREDNPRLLTMLGLQYYQQNYFADAVDSLNKAMLLDPGNPDPRFLLIEAYYRNLEYERALQLASDTVTRFPENALSYYHLGAQLNNFGRLAEAKQQLDVALAKDPNLLEARAMLGDVLFKIGKTAESVDVFREALAHDPKLMNAQAGLGKALIQLKRYPEAASAMEEAIRIDPKIAPLHLYLSQAYRSLGRVDDAKKEAALFGRLNQERAAARDHEVDRKYPN